MAVDRRYYQLGSLLQTRQRFIGMQAEIVFERWGDTREHLDVRTGAEKLFAVAGDDDHLDSFVHPCLEYARVKRLHHFVGIGVCRRIVQGQKRDAVLRSILDQIAGCFYFSRLSFTIKFP